jgi:hypothetical protein
MLAPTERMDLHFGQCLERPDGICSIASVPGCDVTSEMDLKKDNGNSVLTKEERIEKVIGNFFCSAIFVTPSGKAWLTNHSDRPLCFSRIEFLPFSVLPVACGYLQGRFMNRVANMNPERRLKKLMSDRYENMSEERRIKKKEVWTSSSVLNCYVSVRIRRILLHY